MEVPFFLGMIKISIMRTFMLGVMSLASSVWAIDLTEQTLLDQIREVSRQGQIVKLESKVFGEEPEKLKSAYDSSLQMSLNHQWDANEPLNAVFGTRNDTTRWDATFHKQLSTGTLLKAGLLNSRLKSNSPFNSVNPAYNAQFIVGVVQPLWKNAFGQGLKKQIEALKLKSLSMQALTERKIELIYAQTLGVFWQWLFYREYEGVAQDSLKRAISFHRAIVQKSSLGVAEQSDVFAAESNVLNREQLLLNIQNEKNKLCEKIKYDLNLPTGETCQSSQSFKQDIDLKPKQTFVASALKDREDIKALALSKQSLQKSLEANRLSLSPEVNFISEFAINGVSQVYDTAFSRAGSFDHPRFLVGGEIKIPFSNASLKAEKKQLNFEKQKANLEIEELEAKTKYEVSVSFDHVLNLKERLEKIDHRRNLEERKLKAKHRSYQNGRADVTDVLLFEQDVVMANEQYLQTLIDLKAEYLNLRIHSGQWNQGEKHGSH